MKPESLIFDMDGTLWDALDTYVWIWNKGFKSLGIDKHFTRDSMLGMMGMETRTLIKECAPDVDEQTRAKIYETVFGLQDQVMLEKGGFLYDGVREGLERLSGKYKLLMLSNCEKRGIEMFLRYNDLNHLFIDSITHGDNYMPKNYNMKLLMERNKLNHTFYIGDTDSDRKQSDLAGVPFVFVSYGFGKTDQYRLKFDNFSDLTEYFMNL